MSWVLRAKGLHAGYNGRAVVRDFDFELAAGEVVAVLGPNGAGKTTLLSTLAGLLAPVSGSIEIAPSPAGADRRRWARKPSRPVVLLPDDRSLFLGLTARENVRLGCRRGGPALAEVLGRFPQLRQRWDLPAGMLSGGEQQQLAMARALVQAPMVLLIDELSMGLAPLIVDALLKIVREIADEAATAVVLVEQHATRALRVADRGLVLIHGEKVLDQRADELLEDPVLLEDAYFARHRDR